MMYGSGTKWIGRTLRKEFDTEWIRLTCRLTCYPLGSSTDSIKNKPEVWDLRGLGKLNSVNTQVCGLIMSTCCYSGCFVVRCRWCRVFTKYRISLWNLLQQHETATWTFKDRRLSDQWWLVLGKISPSGRPQRFRTRGRNQKHSTAGNARANASKIVPRIWKCMDISVAISVKAHTMWPFDHGTN